METIQSNSDSFDENQSIRVIREMIQVSKKKLRNDGVLFIIWGWLMFYNYIQTYVRKKIVVVYYERIIINYFNYALGIAAFAYSIYYIYKHHKKVQTYIGISLRYVWVSLIVCLSLINMIIQNVSHTTNFELQHPIFMTVIAFAIVVTGGIIRYKLIIAGGVIFALLAYVSSFFELPIQLLLEALAWLIAFVIPGHILYSKRKVD